MITLNRCPTCDGLLQAEGICPACLVQLTVIETDTSLHRINHYEVREILGRGGMGVVHRAWDTILKRSVALKLLQAQDETSFHREAEAIARLHHPGIVQIFEVGETEGQPFLALEYIEGGSLADQIDGTPWEAERAVTLIEQLARAVHVAHLAGVIHRDLKPGNVLMDEDQPKISDFGLARITESAHAQTVSGTLKGTPAYCAPEQATGRISMIGPHSDVYALGAILYELLTGQPPFRGASLMETLSLVANQDPISPRLLNPAVPHDIEVICLKCLEKRPEHRYSSAEELSLELQRWQRSEPIQACPPSISGRLVKWVQRRPTFAALIGVSCIALVCLIALVIGIGLYSRLQEQQHIAQQANANLERERDRVRQLQYASDMGNALQSWRDSEMIRMRSLLDRQLPRHTDGKDLRSFDWRFLWGLCHEEDFVIDLKHRVTGGSISPDGKVLATKGGDNELHFWDLTSRKLLFAVKPTLEYRDLVYSPDGKLIALGGHGHFGLFEVASRKFRFEKEKTSSFQVERVSFTPDSRQVIASCRDGSLQFRDVETGKLAHSSRHLFKPSTVVYHPDGQSHAFGVNSDLIIRHADNRTVTLKGHRDGIRTVLFDRTGERLISSTGQGEMIIWDVAKRRILHRCRQDAFNPTLSSDGRWIATGGRDNQVLIRDIRTGTIVRSLPGHNHPVLTLNFHPNGQQLITTGFDGTIRFWNLDRPPRISRFPSIRMHRPTFRLQISEDGEWLGREVSKMLEVWSLNPLRRHRTIEIGSPVACIAISKHGRRIAFCDKNQVQIHDARTGVKLTRFTAPGPITLMAFSPDAKMLALADHEGAVSLWESGTGKHIRDLPSRKGKPTGLAFNRDGTDLCLTVYPGYALHWDLKRKLLRTLTFGGGLHVQRVGFHPDQRILAMDLYKEVQLWDLSSGRVLREISEHSELVHAFAFSPDGKRIATATHKGNVRIRDVRSGELILTLSDSTEGLWKLQFSSDGNRLIAIGANGLTIWEAATSEEIMQWPTKTMKVRRR